MIPNVKSSFRRVKLNITVIVFILCTVLIILLSPFSIHFLQDGVIQVNTNRPYSVHDNEPDEISFTIAMGQRVIKTKPISPDFWKVYNVPSDCFDSYISSNRVLNRLVYRALFDEDNNPCEITETMYEIFEQIALLEHNLMVIKVYDVGGEIFVYIVLNVNLITPCYLYYFNQSTHKLIEMASFENRAIQGIHIMSEDRLHSFWFDPTLHWITRLLLISLELITIIIMCKKVWSVTTKYLSGAARRQKRGSTS